MIPVRFPPFPRLIKEKTIYESSSQFLSPFLPDSVLRQYKKIVQQQHSIQWNVSHHDFTILLHTEKMSISPSFIHVLVYACTFVSQFSSSPQTFVYNIFPSTLAKKVKHPEEKKWTCEHINTGSTYRFDCSSVMIWRKEEIIKTIFHESIHCQGFEFEKTPSDIEQQIKKHFQLKGSIHLYESYVEFLAELLNIMAFRHYYRDTNRQTFQALYQCEKTHCFQQVAKILKCSGFTTWNEFFSLEMNPDKILVQETPVFSYYIVRSVLYYDPWFLTRIQSVYFYNNFTSIHEYWNRIFMNFQSLNYQKTVDHYMQFTIPTSLSMRMSFLEWNY